MKHRLAKLIPALLLATAGTSARTQQLVFDTETVSHPSSAPLTVTTIRPFRDIDFRSSIDASPLTIVKITKATGPRSEDLTNPNAQSIQSASAVVVDSGSLPSGTSLELVDAIRNGGQPQPLKPGHRYLVYITRAYQSPQGPKSSTQFWLDMAEPTNASHLPDSANEGDKIVTALVDALESATGRDALEIARVLGPKIPGTEMPASWPDHPAPLTSQALRIAHLSESSKDPYVRLACEVLLTGWSVSGSTDRYLQALADVSRVAPAQFEGADLAAMKGQASDPIFKFVSSKPAGDLNRKSFVQAAIAAKCVPIQDLMLRSIGKDQLSPDQVHALAAQLTRPTPTEFIPGQVWQAHLAQICLTLDRNAGADPRAIDPPSAYDPQTGKYSLKKSIAHWTQA